MERQQVGSTGEDLALAHLKKKGYQYRGSNVRTKWGEIDLVMMDGGTLVFVEVKTRRMNDTYGDPVEAVDRFKQSHMIKSAISYLQQTGWDDRPFRFDVVTISPSGVRHIEDAICYEGNFYA